MIIEIDLGSAFFLHCLLIVQDILSGRAPDDSKTNLWLQNFHIYIGNNLDYEKNATCAGGPFMIVGDKENWYRKGEYSGPKESGDMWNYGAEVWCNLEGQFVTIVFDLTHLSGQPYTMTICSLGLMGVEYKRD